MNTFKLNKYHIIFFSLLFVILHSSCTNKLNKKVLSILEFAGKNRPELEKVIQYYSQPEQDERKLKAALFLIENMYLHNTMVSNKLDTFDCFFDSLAIMDSVALIQTPDSIYFKPDAKRKRFDKVYNIWNHFRDTCGPPDEYEVDYLNDCYSIKSDLLIENIEYAFKAWELPWAQHLTFEQFCEYVLPYRFGNEKLVSSQASSFG